MYGQLSYLEVITGAKSFSDFANRLELLKRIIHSDLTLLSKYRNKSSNRSEKAELEEQKARLDALAAEAQKAQDEVVAKKHSSKNHGWGKKWKEAAAQMEADLIAESNNVREMIQTESGSSNPVV